MSVVISPAAAADRLAAARRLGLTFDPSPDHLLVARRDGRVVGATVAEAHGDGLAEVRPPAADDAATADALAVALIERLRAIGVTVAQCLLSPAERASAAPLERAGFRHISQLVTLGRPLAGVGESLVTPLDFEPLSGVTPELVAAFAATLAGSLDMPELTGVRVPAAELAGYPATHRILVRHAGGPVGVLLLARDELLYLGLVPAARGRGWGHVLIRKALAELAAHGAREVRVSADVRNVLAVRLYERHGFRPRRLQEVFLWTAGGWPPVRVKWPGWGLTGPSGRRAWHGW